MRLSFLNFIILKKKIFSLFILLFYLSCSTDDVEEKVPNINITTKPLNNFDRQGMLVFWADSIIIPAHQKFQIDLLNLSNSINDFSSDTSASSLNNIRENWTTAYKSWQHIEMFNVGKSEEINFPVRMNIYPVNTQRIEAKILNSDLDIENPNDYAAQGLPAMDYLLYGIGANNSEILEKYTSENSEYLSYLIVVSNKMVELTDLVVSDWISSYRDIFISSTENTATSSINKLTNDFIYYYEKGFRANKIGIPSGVFSGNTLVDRVEAYYKKDISKTLSIEAITAISNFFKGISFDGNSSSEGISFKDYIEFLETTKNDTPLGQLIIDQFDLSKTALNNLNDDFTVQLESNKLDMLITYDVIQVAVVLLKVDMLQALNINVDYIDADGD